MTNLRASALVFSAWLFCLTVCMWVFPDMVAEQSDLGDAPTWRIVGMLYGGLGYYYLRSGLTVDRPFLLWSVHARLTIVLVAIAAVAVGWLPVSALAFSAVDACGACWTWLGLRGSKSA